MSQEQNEQSWKQLNDELIELYSSGQHQKAIPIGEQALKLAAAVWARLISRSPLAATTWQCCTKRKTAWKKQNPCI